MKKSSNFKYFISEGYKSFTVNGMMSIASTIIVIASLIVFGLYILLSMNINYVAKQIEADCEIEVWIDEGIKVGSADMQDVENHIKAIDNVRGVEFYSKDKALKEWKVKLGEDSAYLDGLENDNPLRDSYKITLNDLNLAGETANELEKVNGIASVSDNRSGLNKLVNAIKIIRNISFWFMAFLSLIAIFIISNTIKITLFARRRDINIMKYLGATDRFISGPFIVEGVVIGLIGALISLIIILIAYNYFLSMDITLYGSIHFCSVGQVFVPLLVWFIVMGAMLSAVGSAISIKRHLKV